MLPEVLGALPGERVDQRPWVTRRRGEHAWALGPASYDAIPGHRRAVPAAAARLAAGAMIWAGTRSRPMS